MTVPDALGIFGSVLIIVAYLANLRGTLSAGGYVYSSLNLAGALLILVSLWWAWNLAAVLTECFWAAISIYGLARAAFRRPA